MSTSIIIFDQNFSANDVDIWYLNLLSYEMAATFLHRRVTMLTVENLTVEKDV